MTGEPVDRLLDRLAIEDCIVRYSRGVDRLDEELLRSVYHEDAYDDHGVFQGSGWDFAAWVVRALAPAECTMHTVSNMLITIDRDVAWGETHVVAYTRFSDPMGVRSDFTLGGRYVDRFERRGGEWRIARRQFLIEWSRVDAIDDEWSDAPRVARGSRDRGDPSYGRAR